MAQYAMENFRCNTSRVDDVTIVCDSSESKDIREHITDRPKKMIQLRRLYVNENEIDRAHREMVKDGHSTFYFTDVKHEFDHVQGGCLKTMELSPDEVTVNLRASVVPWNLQFDLVLIDNLLREMGITPKKITLKIGKMSVWAWIGILLALILLTLVLYILSVYLYKKKLKGENTNDQNEDHS